MGTRIRKVMGYGFKLTKDDRKMLWKRLDEDSYPGEVTAIIEAAQAVAGDRRVSLRFDKDDSCRLQDIIHYAENPDHDRGFHVIVPPSMRERWFRVDDSLDHAQWFSAPPNNDLEAVVHHIKTPLYPFVNWMDPKSGEKLKNYHAMFDEEEFVSKHGYHPVPWVPDSVQVIGSLFGLDWKDFRPMMVTWWS